MAESPGYVSRYTSGYAYSYTEGNMMSDEKRPVRSGHDNKSGSYQRALRKAIEEHPEAPPPSSSPWQPTRDEFIARLRDVIRGMEQEVNAVEQRRWKPSAEEDRRLADCAAIRRAALSALDEMEESR